MAAGLHVGYDYFVGFIPQAGRSLTFGATQVATGLGWDFVLNQFTANPVNATSPLSLLYNTSFYGAYYSIPTWVDGTYQIAIYDTGATPPLLRRLYADVVSSDDGYSGLYAVPPTQVSTYQDRIIKDIRQAIVDAGIIGDPSCVVSLDPKWFPVSGGPYCVITPGGAAPIEGQVAGGGRLNTGMRADVRVRVGDMNLADIGKEDYFRLVDVRYSLLRRAEQIIGQLQIYTPIDASGNALSEEPMRMTGEAGPAPHPDDPTQWCEIASSWEVIYRLGMTPG
jgi:hypothetical protein